MTVASDSTAPVSQIINIHLDKILPFTRLLSKTLSELIVNWRLKVALAQRVSQVET